MPVCFHFRLTFCGSSFFFTRLCSLLSSLFVLCQDTVSDPGVRVADIQAKFYFYSVLRH